MLSPSRELERDYRGGKSAEVLTFPVPASDTGLVAALRSGHPQARRVLCERYSAGLLRIASRILGPDPGVRSVVVETLRWSVTHLAALEDPRTLGTWLSRRLILLIRRRLRAKRVLRGVTDWGGGHWSEADRASEQLTATYRVLDHLSVERRLAFCLVVIDSMRWAEVAAVLNSTSPLIKTRLLAAHAAFRDTVRSSFPQLLRWHSTVAQLAANLAAEQDRKLADVGIYDFELLPSRTERFKPWLFAVLVSLFALVIAGVACMKLWGTTAQSSDPVSVGTWIVSPPRQPTTISFSSGSRITLAPGSRLRMLTSDGLGEASILESGSATLMVGKTNEMARVAAGPFLVTASQGLTDLSWTTNDEALKIVVHRGVAAVSGCQFGLGSLIEPGTSVDTRCLTTDTANGPRPAVAGLRPVAQRRGSATAPDPS